MCIEKEGIVVVGGEGEEGRFDGEVRVGRELDREWEEGRLKLPGGVGEVILMRTWWEGGCIRWNRRRRKLRRREKRGRVVMVEGVGGSQGCFVQLCGKSSISFNNTAGSSRLRKRGALAMSLSRFEKRRRPALSSSLEASSNS
jgi:hypothetical protein